MMAGPENPAETARTSPSARDAFAAAVGALVRSARAKRGMTRRQLAEQSGASERYLAQIESGQGNPSVIILKAIADALEVPVVELLPRTGGAARHSTASSICSRACRRPSCRRSPN